MMDPASLRPFLTTTLEKTDFHDLGEKYAGKVRDVYLQKRERRRILIATDRQSAFDINWCTIPLKGQVLNQVSAWWFRRIADLMPNHVLNTPDPNVTIVKDLRIVPIEIVVRAYLTGSSKTAAWTNYNAGIRQFCGNVLPDGMVKNQPFPKPIITPTTKAADDEMIDPEGILERKLVSRDQWEEIADRAIAFCARGRQVADERGLVLVDTKYEMGFDDEGRLTVADEVHTPDSSRYWIKATYDDRFRRGEEPESLDKEFFRLWLREQGFEYGGHRPTITDDVRTQLGARYVDLYERVTGEKFRIPADTDIAGRIRRNLASYATANIV